jgi:uncharacterized membrane protein
VFDIASHIVDDHGFLTQGSEWLIGIGVVGAVLAAVFGLLDLMTIRRRTRAFATGLLHMASNLAVVAAYIVNFLWRYDSYDDQGRVGIGQLVLSAVALVALSGSGYLGGKLAYRYGVRVATEETQADGWTTQIPTR